MINHGNTCSFGNYSLSFILLAVYFGVGWLISPVKFWEVLILRFSCQFLLPLPLPLPSYCRYVVVEMLFTVNLRKYSSYRIWSQKLEKKLQLSINSVDLLSNFLASTTTLPSRPFFHASMRLTCHNRLGVDLWCACHHFGWHLTTAPRSCVFCFFICMAYVKKSSQYNQKIGLGGVYVIHMRHQILFTCHPCHWHLRDKAKCLSNFSCKESMPLQVNMGWAPQITFRNVSVELFDEIFFHNN